MEYNRKNGEVLEWTVDRKDPSSEDIQQHVFELAIEQGSKAEFLQHIEAVVHKCAISTNHICLGFGVLFHGNRVK